MRCKRASACGSHLFFYVRLLFAIQKMCRHLNYHQRNQRICNVKPTKKVYTESHTYTFNQYLNIDSFTTLPLTVTVSYAVCCLSVSFFSFVFRHTFLSEFHDA